MMMMVYYYQCGFSLTCNIKHLHDEIGQVGSVPLLAMAGCLTHNAFSLSSPMKTTFNQHFCLLSKPSDEAWPYDWAKVGEAAAGQVTRLQKAGSERELLSQLLVRIQKLDPDIIIGHDVSSFELEVLIHRMMQNKGKWGR